MENKLNVTWEDKAALYAVEDFDDYAYKGYLKGASDFQTSLLQKISEYKGSRVYGEIVLPKEFIINLIKKLEANE